MAPWNLTMMRQQQQTACQLLRSLSAALARQPASSSLQTQQFGSKLHAILPPALQRPQALFSTVSQHTREAWHASCSQTLHAQQQRLLQQPSSSWQTGQQGWQYLQQQHWQQPGWQLLLNCSMATRVEQQAAANPGMHCNTSHRLCSCLLDTDCLRACACHNHVAAHHTSSAVVSQIASTQIRPLSEVLLPPHTICW